jgi:hypothetical protein
MLFKCIRMKAKNQKNNTNEFLDAVRININIYNIKLILRAV